MPITTNAAAVAVADLAEAKDFCGRIFDRPAGLEPVPMRAQWDLDVLPRHLDQRGVPS